MTSTTPRLPVLCRRSSVRRARGASGRGQLAAVLVVLGGLLGVTAACERDAEAGGSAGVIADEAGRGVEAPAEPASPLEARPREVTVGVDSALLSEALARAAELPRLHTMIVARDGEIEAERHFRGPGLDVPANVKSASKSLLSALVGLALEDGHLEGLDQPIAPFFADELGEDAEGAKGSITLRDLLSMQSGLESTSSRNYGRWVNSSDWTRYAITRPLVAEPGTRRIYSTGNSHLVSAILTRATGQSTFAFARDRLAEPLGIDLPEWQRGPEGIYFGGNDMFVSPRDLLRFGELYRSGGVYEGREILPQEWIEDSWQAHSRSRRRNRVYGLGWWGRESNGYQVWFAWGYGGQFLFVVPALELTVVFTSDPVSPREGPHNSALHSLMDEVLLPAAMIGASSGVTD